ncbi:MAG TPA: carbonic anhydrase family protein [Methylophilus sp.]|uniref:carbonic anhydrase n=1 Tax=Methylophilus sp. TaxID=29541 RepID=UPI002CFA57B0|nr:carbonic anhydrase family protein [Methylophilus sp.]HSH85781.1 carbonic anhydrase family protein [Methylophilus sp.]
MSRYLFSITYYRFWLASSLLILACLPPMDCQAAQWLSIKKTDANQLMVDKQSLVEEKPYIKAWVKVDYRQPQKNVESVDRVYNHAKALWYFDCAKRKAATIQVFQYDQDELVYSAGTTIKQADFIEPLPDSEVEITQQYACKWQAKEKQRAEAVAKRAANPIIPAIANEKDKPASPNSVAEPATPAAEAAPVEKTNPTKPAAETVPAKETSKKAEQAPATEQTKEAEKDKNKTPKQGKEDKHDKEDKSWAYSGTRGPDKWGSLNPDFAVCNAGSQQSPINVGSTITAALKPIKRLQKFPLKNIALKDHSLVLDAGSGNMMVLDQKPYQLKYISVHAPSEHQIKEKSYAAELQMVHEDKAGHRVIIAVMLEEGTANSTLETLISSIPKEKGQSKSLAIRVTPAELMPTKPAYYRYTGSLTAPPCTEGVQWIIMKEALKISKAQLTSLQQAIGEPNLRPIQDSQGRMILE